ncbi:MAG TPA: amidohydrolase family protein [Acidimicrobiales bacterium]|jgi:predicted TIM-barrel fold metal-dependent hydrolase|nr:amidohydrolase family protein [Acidimicrobiales bacterium]
MTAPTTTPDRLISADSHVQISLDAVRARVPAMLRDAFDGAIAASAKLEAEQRGGRTLSLDSWDMEAMKDPGYRDPVARLAAMDRDGVQAEVLYSEVSAFRHFGLVQGDWRPISRAFTDELAAFAAIDPDRLAVSYQVPIIDIDYAAAEVERLAELGARSVHLPNFPSELGLPDYHEPHYDRLWGVLSETGLSISHHLGNRPSLYDVLKRDPTPQAAIFTSLPAFALAEVIGWWILTGTLERFPKLRIVFVEPNLHWIPGFLAGLDRKANGRYDLPGLKMKPSEYFRRNMACTFLDDEVGLSLRHLIGIENIMWSTDFPHPATTWPHSREVVDRQFADIPADERELIVAGNASRLYNL